MSVHDTTTTSTTTTTTTHYFWERRPAGALPWVIGGLGLLGLGLLHGIPQRHSMEGILEDKSRSVLAQAGATGATIDFTGRDGVLAGTLPPGVDAKALVASLEKIDGVRIVKAQFGGTAAGTAPSADASASPTPAASPEPSASPSASVTATLPNLTAVSANGKVTLTGAVPSEEVRKALVSAAEATYGAGNVVDQLTIDAAVSTAGIGPFGDLVAGLGKGSAATAALKDGALTLSGSVADDATVSAATAAAAKVTGDAAKVSSTLTAGGGTSAADVQAQLDKLPQITFVSGSTEYTSQGAATVAQAGKILKANPSVKVGVNGYTDDVGDWDANMALSRARAETVVASLKSMGVAGDRMTSSGFGESKPKVPNTSDANRAQNRRVSFTVR